MSNRGRDLDPAKIMAEHRDHETVNGACKPIRINVPWRVGPCDMYRLAEALAAVAEREKRVRALAGEYDKYGIGMYDGDDIAGDIRAALDGAADA